MIWYRIKGFFRWLWFGPDWATHDHKPAVVVYGSNIIWTGKVHPLQAAIRLPVLDGGAVKHVAVAYATNKVRFGVSEFRVARFEEERTGITERYKEERGGH